MMMVDWPYYSLYFKKSMQGLYDKIETALKEIRKLQSLIAQGLGKPEDKAKAFDLAKEIADQFTNDIWKRKVEKLSRITQWSKQTKDGFVAPDEAAQLDNWIKLLEDFKEGRKIKSHISNENVHIKSVLDGEDRHIFITKQGSDEHTHLIIDNGTGEIRIDPKDKSPHELLKSIQSTLKLSTGETVQITESELKFVEPENPKADIKVYTADKDGYFVLEIYNNGDEDLEDINVEVEWEQPEGPHNRVLQKFNDVSDYLVMASPRSLNMLPVGVRVYATGVPSISVNKKLKVTVMCKGLISGHMLKRVFNLETLNSY